MKNFTEHKIDHDFSNTRIDRWFRQYFEGLSHNNLEKYLRKGFIRVNEKKIRSSYRLNKGDIILLAHGGHGFEILEQAEIIEVKQGPYSGDFDKSHFD